MSEEEIKVIKTASCPSLSGRSTIAYEVGGKGECQYIRLSGNSAGGIFCKDWISLTEILQILSVSPKLTSKTLHPLYSGKSTNSPGFLLACILNERPEEKDSYVPVTDTPAQEKTVKVKKVAKKPD